MRNEITAFGFQTLGQHTQSSRQTDIICVTFNSLLKKFIIVDGRGISSWSPEKSLNFTQELTFPKYQNRLLRNIVFCEKHNVYFAICSDFTLQVYNKNFEVICKAESPNIRSILHMVFNSKRNELITTGLRGTNVWEYKQVVTSKFNKIKPMANYSLILSGHHTTVGGSWCTNIYLMEEIQQVFFCSEVGFHVHDCENMKLLWQLNRAHDGPVSCIAYWLKGRLIITGSMDSEIKVWSSTGGHICTFRGHSRPVTSVVVHPHSSGFVMSSSLDGTVKVWSLTVLEQLYNYNVFSDGIDWMGITPSGNLWCATVREIAVYKFNSIADFWGQMRCSVANLQSVSDYNKSSRILSTGYDGSIRLFRQTTSESNVLCTVLPPPVVSLEDVVFSVTYSRHNNLFFVLINPCKIWVYTAKTDPACRIAEWDVEKIQSLNDSSQINQENTNTVKSKSPIRMKLGKQVMNRPQRAEYSDGQASECSSLLCVSSSKGFAFHGESGKCTARSRNLLALGLANGKLLFMDEKTRGFKYFEMNISVGEVEDIKQQKGSDKILTLCSHLEKIIQIWGLPDWCQLFKFTLEADFTCYSFFMDLFVLGHHSGKLTVKKLNSKNSQMESQSEIGNSPGQVINIQPSGMTLENGSFNKDISALDHKAPVIDIKECTGRKIFCSCSLDGTIKIWDFEKTLLNELVLDESLSACVFLNSLGDLLVGWKRHVFIIHHETVSSHLGCMTEDSMETIDCESEIYEDPAFKRDSKYNDFDDEPLDMQKYLVPYKFVTVEDLEKYATNAKNAKEEDKSSCSSLSEHAPTDVYLSPASSYNCLAFFSANPALKTSKMDNDYRKDFKLPTFGTSPVVTPSISSESEVEIIEEPEIEDTYDPVIWKSEVILHVAQQVTLAKNVTKAVSLMKNEVLDLPEEPEPEEPEPEEPEHEEQPSSRLSGRRINAKALMKAAVTAVIATQKLAKEAEPKTSKSRRSSTRFIKKKTRRDSSVNLKPRRKSSPAIVNKPPEVAKVSTPPIQTIGFPGKEIPFGKGPSIPTRHDQRKIESEVLTAENISKQPKLKFPGSQRNKSAKVQSRKSGSSLHRKSKSATDRKIPSATKLKEPEGPMLVQSDTKTTTTTGKQGTMTGRGLGEAGGPVTQVQMTYNKRPETFAQKDHRSEGGEGKGLEDSKGPGGFKQTEQKNEAANADFAKMLVEKFLQSGKDEIGGTSLFGYDRFSRRRGSQTSTEDLDLEKESNVVNCDLQAIYKKDGLRFDECWQERMLKRYQLMKLQREQRHLAAANKRTVLEHERKYKILSHRPELMYQDTFAWYEEHARQADHVMRSPLLTGQSEALPSSDALAPKPARSGIISPVPGTRAESAPPAARPPSAADTLGRTGSRQSTHVGGERKSHSDLLKKYRFSFRPSPDTDGDSSISGSQGRPCTAESNALMAPAGTPAPPNPTSVTTIRPAVSVSKKLLVDRPRSSTSIPGKTRYVLMKADLPTTSKARAPSPSKLEEGLLKSRFPSQHQQLMRTLAKYDDEDCRAALSARSVDATALHDSASYRRRLDSNDANQLRSSMPNMRSARDHQRRPLAARESSPAFLPAAARDPSLVSVLHRKSFDYVPTAFQV